MLILLLFSFVAGIVTIASPCILPILPVVLSSGISDGKGDTLRPYGIVLGFVASFTFFTLFLSQIVTLSGISADLLRNFSIFIIALSGAALILPAFNKLSEKLFSKITSVTPLGIGRSGFFAGFLVGLSIGLLWTPCVGPILASVITLAISGTVTTQAFLITLFYSLGTALPMFLIISGGRNVFLKIPGLYQNLPKVQKVFGIVMIIVSIMIFLNIDRKFQYYFLQKFPTYGTGLTNLEEKEFVKKLIEKNMEEPKIEGLLDKGLLPAPEIVPGGKWFNSEPLQLSKLKGRVVVIDFWTYTCINCIRTIPYLKGWYDKYESEGLVILGVHAPEFEFEKNPENVSKAIKDFGIRYPVFQDNFFGTWNAYQNNAWPAKYFIDKDGYIRYARFGEGGYDQSEKVIQKLLSEENSDFRFSPVDNPTYKNESYTPETYLGYGRMEGNLPQQEISKNSVAVYKAPEILPPNSFAFDGDWRVSETYSNPQKGARLLFNFDAKEVFLVMRAKNGPSKVKVSIKGQNDYLGEDATEGTVTVSEDRLYKIIRLPVHGRQTLELEFEDGNTEVYAFTFG